MSSAETCCNCERSIDGPSQGILGDSGTDGRTGRLCALCLRSLHDD